MKPWMMALIAGQQRVLKTAGPYTSNTVFNVPPNVTALVKLTGKGADGAASSWSMDTHSVMSCTRTSTNQVGGVLTPKLDAVLDGSNEVGAFSVGGDVQRTITHKLINYLVGPDNLARRGTPISITRTVRGEEVVEAGSTSGNITHTPSSTTYVRVTVDTRQGGTTGANATAFGKTFAGGVEGPAVPVTLDNVPVTPGSAVSLIVPAGGSVTFTYYE